MGSRDIIKYVVVCSGVLESIIAICDRICKNGSSTHIQFTNFDNS